jgi:hypothetical protein
MTSLFSWVDHSEQERRQILDAIDLFREQGTVDELGIGTIRDAFADLLFPGTASMQTRARYFLFVPWMYRQLAAKRVRAGEIAARARQFEVRLINVLADSPDPDGTIGRQSRAALHRMPSNIYWNSLKKIGIRLFGGSQDEYHRAFDQLESSVRVPRTDDGDPVSRVVPPWHPGLPEWPDGFPDVAVFALTRDEASYLRERIVTTNGGTLFRYFLDHLNGPAAAEFPWDHPVAAELPAALGEQLAHARRFSTVMYGAAILYNLLVSRQPPVREDKVTEYEEMYATWAAEAREAMGDLRAWDLGAFWTTVHLSDPTRRPMTEWFVQAWVELVRRAANVAQLADSAEAELLIRHRERRVKKKGLARLENARARELWGGASGRIQIEYRWRNARQVLNDIEAGLAGGRRA